MSKTHLLIVLLGIAQPLCGDQPGTLVIVGGGKMPPSARAKFHQLAGGEKARIVVLAQASSRPDRGNNSTQVFANLGAIEVTNVKLDDLPKAKTKITGASGIWFPGGSQKQLYQALQQAKLLELIRSRHQAGVPCGGTSAGAAILSKWMITQSPGKPGLVQGNTPVQPGLALVPELIIDQHFLARHRMGRLLGAVLDHPDQIGVGIGESTAIVVNQGQFKVLGTGSVVVIDPRGAKLLSRKKGTLQSGSGIIVNLYKAGQTFQFK